MRTPLHWNKTTYPYKWVLWCLAARCSLSTRTVSDGDVWGSSLHWQRAQELALVRCRYGQMAGCPFPLESRAGSSQGGCQDFQGVVAAPGVMVSQARRSPSCRPETLSDGGGRALIFVCTFSSACCSRRALEAGSGHHVRSGTVDSVPSQGACLGFVLLCRILEGKSPVKGPPSWSLQKGL